jgi:hypothetical protein
VGEHYGIVVPLALGAAISPTTLALQLFVLSRKTAPLARAWAIAAGYTVVLLAMMAIAFFFAASTGSGSQSKPEAWLKLACAVGLAALGVIALRRPPKQRKQAPEGGEPKLGRFFAIGVALMATNLTTAALYLPAMHDVGDAGASAPGVVLAALVVIAITLFPAARGDAARRSRPRGARRAERLLRPPQPGDQRHGLLRLRDLPRRGVAARRVLSGARLHSFTK